MNNLYHIQFDIDSCDKLELLDNGADNFTVLRYSVRPSPHPCPPISSTPAARRVQSVARQTKKPHLTSHLPIIIFLLPPIAPRIPLYLIAQRARYRSQYAFWATIRPGSRQKGHCRDG